MASQPSTIHEAISWGDLEDLKKLIRDGKTEELNKLDGSGRTPLAYCVDRSSGARTTPDMPEDGTCIILLQYEYKLIFVINEPHPFSLLQ